MQPIDFVFFAIFSVMIFSSVLYLVVYLRDRERVHVDPELTVFPTVTFLVPAYNEEEHIAETIKSLLNQNYPEDKLEIIAINDGSEDGTLKEMKKFKDKIQIIDKENTGKAASMNYALERVDTDVVGCMDGDSFAEPNMVKNMVAYFQEENVKGVTPALKVENPTNWVQKVIWAEYIYQIFLRKIFAIFDSQYVMPGPGSLYDTDYLKEVGGWDEDTLTEDMEIAFRMFTEGAKLENSTNAYVSTISPPTFKGLYRQRVRWYRGYINNFIKYSDILFRREHGNLGMFFMPFNFVWTVIVLFVLVHLVFNMANTLFQTVQSYLLVGFMAPTFNFSIQSISTFHIFYAWFLFIGLGVMFLSVKTAGEELKLWRRKTHYILFLWIYTFLYAIFWIAAIIEEIGGEYRW